MGKLLNTIIVGAASGAAAAYFLSTEKGKEVKEKVRQTFEGYRENPDDYHQYAADKASEYKDKAVDTFNDYKDRFESGDLTVDDILAAAKGKANQASDFANSKFNEAREHFNQAEETVKDVTETESEAVLAQVDDIVIDYPELEETELGQED